MNVPIEEITKWEIKRKLLNDRAKQNREDYEKKKNEFEEYKGMYIAFSENKVQIVSESLNEVTKYHDIDPTAVILRVGYESEKSSSNDVLL